MTTATVNSDQAYECDPFVYMRALILCFMFDRYFFLLVFFYSYQEIISNVWIALCGLIEKETEILVMLSNDFILSKWHLNEINSLVMAVQQILYFLNMCEWVFFFFGIFFLFLFWSRNQTNE